MQILMVRTEKHHKQAFWRRAHRMKGLAYLLVAVVALTGAVMYVAQASERSDGQGDPVFGINIPSG